MPSWRRPSPRWATSSPRSRADDGGGADAQAPSPVGAAAHAAAVAVPAQAARWMTCASPSPSLAAKASAATGPCSSPPTDVARDGGVQSAARKAHDELDEITCTHLGCVRIYFRCMGMLWWSNLPAVMRGSTDSAHVAEWRGGGARPPPPPPPP